MLTNGWNFAEAEGDRESPEESQDQPNHTMTPEELLKMRMEILPQL
jgi:hypothetical protein